MFELDFSANAVLLIGDSLLDSVDNTLLQVLQLRLVLIPCLFEQLRERALLGLLFADRFPQLASFSLHLHLVRSFLYIRVVCLLILSGFVVHLLQSIALGVRIRPRSWWPVDVVNLGECSLGVFDRSDDFAILVSCTAEANGHALSIEPCEDSSENCVDGSECREGDAGALLVCRKTGQSCCDEDL